MNSYQNMACGGCGCHHKCNHDFQNKSSSFSRREFINKCALATIAGLTAPSLSMEVFGAENSNRSMAIKKPLVVQPVLTYDVPARRDATSWRNWGTIQTDAQAKEECERITNELNKVAKQAEFEIKFLPIETVRAVDKAQNIANGNHDVLLLYAAGGWVNLLEALTNANKWNLMFLRHDSGPVYLWYEIVHSRFFRKTVDEITQPGWQLDDIVVDKPEELLWRFRALYGLKNALGKKIICIGGPGGWGKGGAGAPTRTREIWKMELLDYPYKELGKKLEAAYADKSLVNRNSERANNYLKQRGVKLQTDKQFVERAFVLDEVFRDLMAQEKTDAITVNACMGTIMQVSKTTACLPLTLINDDDGLAFCESDFVVIPSGVLLHYISGLPVFLCNPNFPHDNMITFAHCTAPRKMDGKHYEPTLIVTHFESDYGAAPKVDMKIGQKLTCLGPDFASKRWLGLNGTIIRNPFLDICRSQIDVKIHGDPDVLKREMRGFHWMICYGDYLKEVNYALQKVGIEFLNLSKTA